MLRILGLYCKYNIVGLSGLFVNAAIFNLLLFTRFFDQHYILANTIAFCFAVSNNFLWNYKWTFRHSDRNGSIVNKYIKFFLIGIIGLIISNAMLGMMVHSFAWNKRTANIVTILLVSMLNFTANYLIVFTPKKEI